MKDYEIITLKEPRSVITEQYRKIKSNIEYSKIDDKYQIINITSTFPAEGKTLTCLNLASVFAQNDAKVLLVDLDLRNPKIHRGFHLSNTKGIGNYMIDELSKEEIINPINKNLDVITAGKRLPYPNEAVDSKKMKTLMSELREQYDYIILDCPPLTAVSDGYIISNFSDATLFVTASRSTNKKIAKQVIEELKKTKANVIGAVLTKVAKRDSSYNYGYYYYGH